MTTPDITFQISISEVDVGNDQLDRLTVGLMHQLRDLGAESVARTRPAPPPAGAKGMGMTTGALNVVATPGFISRMMGFFKTWSSRGGRRTVKIETPSGLKIEFTPDRALSPEEMNAFVQALTASTPPAPAPNSHRPVDIQCRNQLYDLLSTRFNESELRALCFYVAINWEDLSGNNRSDKIIALLRHAERHHLLDELLDKGRYLRKDISWDGICAPTGV